MRLHPDQNGGWFLAPRPGEDAHVRHLNLAPLWETSSHDAVGEQAFLGHTAKLARSRALVTSALIASCLVLWWPLDGLLMPDEAHIQAFFQLRASALGVVSVSWLCFWLTRPVRTWTAVLAAGFYALFMVCVGLALGRLGVTSWLGDAFIGLLPMALLPMDLRTRGLANTGLGLALLGGYFLPYPDNLEAPGAWGQISFAVFAVLAALAAGEISQRNLRQTFFSQRELERVNAQLADLTITLEQQVAQRTEELRALTQHTHSLQEAERRRLARDLHDDLGQHLTAMRYAVSRLEQSVEAEAPSDDTLMLIEDLDALLEGTHSTMHGVISRLRPRILDDLGLEAALEWLCEQTQANTGVPCRLEVDEAFGAHGASLSPQQALVLFRAAQEAITNALKHAAPSLITVRLGATAATAQVAVCDDGCGFEVRAPTGGFGLLGLHERARGGGGELTLLSTPGGGATLRVVLPLQTTQEDTP